MIMQAKYKETNYIKLKNDWLTTYVCLKMNDLF